MPPRLNKLFPPHVIREGGRPVKTVYNIRCSNCRLIRPYETRRTVSDDELMRQYSDWGWVLGRHDRDHDLCPACVAAESGPAPEPKRMSVEELEKLPASKLAEVVFSKVGATQSGRPGAASPERERVFATLPQRGRSQSVPSKIPAPEIPAPVAEPSRPLRPGMSTPDPAVEEAKRQAAERRIAADLAVIKSAIGDLSAQMAQLTALYEKVVLTSSLARVPAQSAITAQLAATNAGSAVGAPGVQPPRRRGRPPKIRPAEVAQLQPAPAPVQDIPTASEVEESESRPAVSTEEMPRRRGRPPKGHFVEEVSSAPEAPAPAAEDGVTIPRRRGRPPKRVLADEAPVSESTVTAQMEERDPVAEPAAEGPPDSPRGRGRPRKKRILADDLAPLTAEQKLSGATTQTEDASVPRAQDQEPQATPLRRLRGRPRKVRVPEQLSEPVVHSPPSASPAAADDQPLARRSKGRHARILVD